MRDESAAEELRRIGVLKARYFRYLDLKAWVEFRQLFTADMQFWRDATPFSRTETPVTESGDAFVRRIQDRHKTSVTVHHGHMPELELTGPDSATGTWAMFDWVDDHTAGRAWKGYGFYEEAYARGEDGEWRISRLRLIRTRVVVLPPTDPAEIDAGGAAWLGTPLAGEAAN